MDQIKCGNVDFTCAMIWPWLSSLGVVGAVNWDWVGLRRGGTEVSNNSPRPDSPGYPITLFCLFPDTTIWDYLVHCTLTYSLSFPLNTHTHTHTHPGALGSFGTELWRCCLAGLRTPNTQSQQQTSIPCSDISVSWKTYV